MEGGTGRWVHGQGNWRCGWKDGWAAAGWQVILVAGLAGHSNRRAHRGAPGTPQRLSWVLPVPGT